MFLNIKLLTDEEIEDIELTEEMKVILNERLMEDETDYLTKEESIALLKGRIK